jgi:diguanylate cyclase (GGDEF)-like protein
MLTAAKPKDDFSRLQTLRSLNILDTDPEERFDRLTRLARRLFEVPIASVSLVDENRVWAKSQVGLDTRETSRDISLCSHTILGNEILLITDTLQDERFADNPQVIDTPHIRFYAGVPLSAGNGCKLGTLCLFDTQPRILTDDDRALLIDLAKMAEQELIAIHMATMDELTLISNRRGFNRLAQYALSLCCRVERSASLFFFDLDHFKQINDGFGHAEGDFALKKFSEILRKTFRESDVVGRLGGDEFVVLSTNLNPIFHETLLARLSYVLAQHNQTAGRGYEIQFSVGTVQFDAAKHDSIDQLLHEADIEMYANKQARRTMR